jgi:hypothetical protein
VAKEKEKEEETDAEKNSSLVERWLQEQQQWQQTAMTYLDSMAKSDDFLVHLGNAMRGSLLAGKPYPSAAPSANVSDAPEDDRLDRILFALHKLEGRIQDLQLSVDELRAERAAVSVAAPAEKKKAQSKRKSAKLRPSKPKGAE